MKIIQFIIDYFENCPDILKTSWILTAIFSMIILGIIALLGYTRESIAKREKLTSKYREEYEQMLVNFLFAENEDPETFSPEQNEIIRYFKFLVKNPFKRKIIIQTLLKLKNDISGDMADTIDRFYVQTGMVEYDFKNLKSRKWYLLAKSIRELGQFNITKAKKVVIKHINHPHSEVRIEVAKYMIKVFHFQGLSFLDKIKNQMSEWDQIQLLEILGNVNTHETIEINHWLKSDNDSVVHFVLRIARIFKLFEIQDELKKLIHHPNEKIRIEVIHLLDHFFVTDYKDELIEDFHTRTIGEQIAIFQMLENFGIEENETFLLNNLHHDNFEIRVSARRILKNLNSKKFDLTQPSVVKIIHPTINCSS